MDKEKIKSIFWDYDVDYTADELYDFIVGNREIKEFNRSRVIARMLTSMRWYDLVDIFGINQLFQFLNDDVLTFIWKKSLKNRYKNVRETLQGIL
jgi:activator of HSP90 ATPase